MLKIYEDIKEFVGNLGVGENEYKFNKNCYLLKVYDESCELYAEKGIDSELFNIDLIQNLPNTKAVVDALKKAGFTLYAAHPRGGSCAIGEKFSQKNVIVIGNEANGITTAMLHHCDKLLTIPMPGGTESLNASVAAALMIYEVIRN